MAVDTKITDLTAQTTPDDADVFVDVDVDDTTMSATGTDKKITWANIKATLLTWLRLGTTIIPQNSPRGFLINGKIVPSVASNNLTVAIKGLDGNDPSATNPVYIRIGDTVRSITSALSVTINAGTNTFNSGCSELATVELDYPVVLGYNATDGVTIGIASPKKYGAKSYGDFSTTATSEDYCAINDISNAVSTDPYEVIGRFAATLSAGAGYTWTVPTFTENNLIQKPIYESRLFTWNPQYSGSDAMTFTSVTSNIVKAKIVGEEMHVYIRAYGTTGGTASHSVQITLPYNHSQSYQIFSAGTVFDGSNLAATLQINNSTKLCNFRNYNGSNWALGASKYIISNIILPI